MVKQFLFAVVLILIGLSAHSQFQIGAEYETSILRSPEKLTYYLINYNENETFDTYEVRNELGAVSHSLGIRSFGAQFLTDRKKSIGYSLGIGYRYFQSNSELVYLNSSTTYRDSIVNSLEGFTFKTNYHVIRFNNFFDFHWNPSEKIKVTNSIGVGLEAIVSAKSKRAEWDSGMINNNHPIAKLVYQPQITERYRNCSVTLFASFDLFAMHLFENNSPYSQPDFRIPFAGLSFNGLGIRILPHIQKEKKDIPLEELD